MSPVYSPPAAGSAATGIPTIFNVKDYGALGDGTTDDTTAIAAAITAVPSAGGTVFFPAGTFRLTSITIPASKPITIVGAGIAATNLKQFTATISGSSVDMFNVPSSGTLRVRDMTMEGPTAVTSPLEHRQIHAIAGSLLVDCKSVRFYKFNFGIWSEAAPVAVEDCEFDGGSGGTALGALYCTGILANTSTTSRLDMRNCFFTDCGATADNQSHGIYAYSGVDCNFVNCRFTRLWGTGFHSQHFGTGGTGKYVQHTNSYFGPAASTNAAQAVCCGVATPLTFVNCTWSINAMALWLGNACRVKVVASTFTCSPAAEMITTGDVNATLVMDGCDFLGTPGKVIYAWSNGAKIAILNSRFTGASTQDVQFDTGLTTAELTARGNTHSGATFNCYQLASGARAVIEDNRFVGTVSDAAIDNVSGSTLALLRIARNDFSQTGTSVILTATPATLTEFDNTGSVGYKTQSPNTWVVLTYSASMTPLVKSAESQRITVTNGTAMTINAPTGGYAGAQLNFDILNSSGGAMGAITWNAAFKLAGAFTNPASTKRRTISFVYDGTSWIELSRAAADI